MSSLLTVLKLVKEKELKLAMHLSEVKLVTLILCHSMMCI